MLKRLWSAGLDEILGFYLLHRYFYYKKQPLILSDARKTSPELSSGELTTFFSPAPQAAQLDYLPQLTPTSQAKFDTAQVIDFQFPSPIQTDFPENNLVKGRHWKSTTVPQETELNPRYTVIAVDGIVQMGVRSFNRLAQRLTPAGIDVVMMDGPFNFRRTPTGYRPGQLIAGGNLDHQLSVARQGVLDLWSLILAFQNKGHQVGLVGISHGAWMTLTTALLIEQLDFVVAITPPVDLFNILEEGGTVVNAIRRGIANETMDREKLEHLCRPLIVSNWEPKVPTSAIHLHIADYDRFVPTFRIEGLAKQWQTHSSHHPLGHIEATNGPKVITQVSSDILKFWNRC